MIAEDLPAVRMPRLPLITPAGVNAVMALVKARDPITEWLAGVPGWVLGREEWFCPHTMRAVAEDTGYTATTAEAAGVFALEVFRRNR